MRWSNLMADDDGFDHDYDPLFDAGMQGSCEDPVEDEYHSGKCNVMSDQGNSFPNPERLHINAGSGAFVRGDPKGRGPSVEIIGKADTLANAGSELPLYLSPIEAGFPSPADDFIEQKLNLHKYLVRNEAATFFLRAHGESMINAGILDGDLLVVDRSVPAEHNRIVIAALEGDLTVKRLVRRRERVFLAAANPDYPDFEITNCEYLHIWGVVMYAIHKL